MPPPPVWRSWPRHARPLRWRGAKGPADRESPPAPASPRDGFLIMLRSASSASAAEIGRAQIEKHYQKVLSNALHGELAAQRAAIVLSLVAGFQVMRQMVGLSALSKTKPEALVKILAPLFEQLIRG